MSLYKSLVRPFLFKFEPEKAHDKTFRMLRRLDRMHWLARLLLSGSAVKDRLLETELFGITFPNPVGLAAGLDKNGEVYDVLGMMGFGYIEIGTVTPRPQPGNPEPRLFRLLKDKALINRMGFNNYGLDFVLERLRSKRTNIIIGGNIGKNKNTANEHATSDYEKCFDALHRYVDYFVVNVSSPNTPNLRSLQEKGPLTELLSTLMRHNRQRGKIKPILLKIAPDLTKAQLDDIVEIVLATQIHGIVATNTTISRDHLTTDKSLVEECGPGGLSGRPLTEKSTEIIAYLYSKLGNKVPIIASGGIMTAKDAIDKLKAGAKMVQIYTGFIYEGSRLIKDINLKILELKRKGEL